MFVLSISLLLLSFIHHGDLARTATAVLYQANSNITNGTLTFFQNDPTTAVNITGTISGLANNSAHGFHVHALPVSELFPNCTAASTHFNPYNVSHGPRIANISSRHVGDLGNITTDATGGVYVNISDMIIDLYNVTRSILNLTIVVHAMFDDGGNTNMDDSATTGNAGGRLFCGLIKLVSDTPSTTTSTTPTTTSMALSNNKSTPWILLMLMFIRFIFFY